MISLLLGLTAFVLYFLYDINSFTRQIRFVHCFFAVGPLLLGGAAVLDLTDSWKNGYFSGMTEVI